MFVSWCLFIFLDASDVCACFCFCTLDVSDARLFMFFCRDVSDFNVCLKVARFPVVKVLDFQGTDDAMCTTWCPQSIPQRMPPKTLPGSFFLKLIAKALKREGHLFSGAFAVCFREWIYVTNNRWQYISLYNTYVHTPNYVQYIYIYISLYIYVHMFPTTSFFFQSSNFAAAVCGRPQGFYLMSGTNLGEGKGRSTIDGLGCGCGYMMVIGR